MNPSVSPASLALKMGEAGHYPVMLAEMLHAFQPVAGKRFIDGTFGGGGYSRALLEAGAVKIIGIDRDPDAIARARPLQEAYPGNLTLLQGAFGDMAALAASADPDGKGFDGIVLDIGVSSFQLDNEERGFSFRRDGPLDMRMSRTGRSAADLVNGLPESELASILYHYGEERHSRRIARAIAERRRTAPINSTLDLANLVRSCLPRPPHGPDSATRSFQALRIAVNDELGELERVLQTAPALLAPGGSLAVISFHSLEDRLVKNAFRIFAGKNAGQSRHLPLRTAFSAPPLWRTGKNIRPSEQEISINPRSRSARLRVLTRMTGEQAL